MFRAFRTLLVWLIMLTLPVQAVSASIMALKMEMPGQSQHSISTINCHGEAQLTSESDSPSSPVPLKAKACSPCCAGALMGAITLPEAFVPSASPAHYATLQERSTGHIPDGLERPPKRIS